MRAKSNGKGIVIFINPLERLPQPIEIYLPDPVLVPAELPTYAAPPVVPIHRLSA
ncbi:hypothetical protein [Phormidium sp. FACHB-1136]|uniref:hypothetical protein n=1 Tax=Phormidium sp. FACHB-1136 TaxID=2692848 RepID=UPI001684D5CE|nr:hypothetical protein [Phormidium sp. FACHB-1136]MBD2425781.1 hypothetical protein [Phormidium sp. FACHB-1136]